jgi:hypothetical protein
MRADSNGKALTINSDERFGLIDAEMEENSRQLKALSTGILTIYFLRLQ